MYLSDRDAHWAIGRGHLIVDAPGASPPKIDPSSIDLRLDAIGQAKVWDVAAFEGEMGRAGGEPVLHVGSSKYKYGDMSRFLVDPPGRAEADRTGQKVYGDGDEIRVRPGGFLLWQTKEKVGTPEVDPRYICFVDGKSTRARAGLIVHLTAPTIHAGWSGNVTLEIANLGPFTFGLREDDVIAQLTVAMISSAPEMTHEAAGSSTAGQTGVGGAT